MKRRTLALALACALSLALLTACGGNSGSTSSSLSGSSQSSSNVSTSEPDASLPGSSQPEGSQSSSTSQGEGSQSSAASSSSQEQTDGSQAQPAKLTLNRTDFSLFTTGATFRLKAAGVPDGTSVVWSSSNDKVATVGEDGTVTYVSAGSATITATAGDLTATCKVYCKAQETEQPDNGGSSSSGSGSSSGSSSGSGSSSTKVDLAAFHSTVSSSYDVPGSSEPADAQLLDQYFSGLSSVKTEQCLVYLNMLSMNMGEMALVQVSDSADVDTVKSIFQARVDYMSGADGGTPGAWYPEPTRLWTENARVVSNGNYVMMIVSEDCDAIVKEFNALF